MITFDVLSRIELEEATEFLNQNFPLINEVDLVIQFGSGQNPEDLLDEVWTRVSLHEMPHIPTEKSTAKHKLEVIWGTAGKFKILIFSGRFHMYEGYGRVPCTLPIWAAATCGASNFMFTNSAAAINPIYKPGTFMIFCDHINNLGVSPLAGQQHLIKTPYADMTQTYTSKFSSGFTKAGSYENAIIHEGVYMAYLGPQYETPAEIRLAKMIGADAVGMSTVLEATTARALRAKVMAVSMIKNTAPGVNSRRISQKEAAKIGKESNKILIATIKRWLSKEAKALLSKISPRIG